MEPIAIIGMGCRFPGAQDPGAFWQLLRDEADAISEVPSDRWDVNAFYDPKPGTPGKMNTRWGGFLPQVDRFDPHFFGIAPREAIYIDPQQRLLLEVAWESLEHAGQVPEQLARSQTGVFIGISSNDYQQVLKGGGGADNINAYLGTGNAFSIAANRLSYFFDFRGPSLAIDTACSSSLVAVHLACQSLRSGESNLVLAGGVNLLLRPEVTMIFSQAQMMAPDGRCKTFDARANGYVRAEGCGIVVLKRLKNALEEGDRVLAVIRGSAINQDGRSNGITAPNGPAQEAVLKQALINAEVTPSQIDYVELHGTGTSLGDPIEAEALGNVLTQGRPADERCAVGSVKTNIGHLESAAGIAGLIKVALSLQHRQIPASLHFQTPNPYIPLDRLPLKVQTALGAWPCETKLAIAGVSSFGFGGTNAHVILEAAPQSIEFSQPKKSPVNPAYLLPLSAKSLEALHALVQSYSVFLNETDPESTVSLQDLCYTASLRRSHHEYRLTLTFRDRAELLQLLATAQQGETAMQISKGTKLRNRRPKLVFVFPGQGPQWWAMGRELWEHEPVFRAVLEQCDRLLHPHTDWSLLEELLAQESQSRLSETEIAQPALVSIQVALVALWKAWGVDPNAVVGHSLGEITAAYVAGVLTLEDALQVVYHRARLMQKGTGLGQMAAVELSQSEADLLLAGYADRLAIAAINSPTSVVLSGESEALEEVLELLQEREVFTKVLPVNYAFHSPQMEPFKDELAQSLQGLHPKPAKIRLLSTVTGQPCQGLELDAQHWASNIREPVRFATVIEQLVQDKHTLFLEISPHPILSGYISQCLGPEGVVLPSLRRQMAERVTMLGSLGALYTHGYPVDWHKLYPASGTCINLPTYPWQRSRYWVETVQPSQPDKPLGAIELSDSSGQSQPETVTEEPWGLSRQELLDAEPGDRPQQLEIYYQALLAKVMGIPSSQIQDQKTLLSLGLDSLMAVELHRQIEKHLEVSIPWEEFPGLTTSRFTTLVLDHLTSPPASPSQPTRVDPPQTRSTPIRSKTEPISTRGPQPLSDNPWILSPTPKNQATVRLFCLPYA
jgi:acyl transferase domain-containing protein